MSRNAPPRGQKSPIESKRMQEIQTALKNLNKISVNSDTAYADTQGKKDNDFISVNEVTEKEKAEKEIAQFKSKQRMYVSQRSADFTELVEFFVKHYKEKCKQNKSLKFWFFVVVMVLFAVTLLTPIGIVFFTAKGVIDGAEVITISISSLCSIVASIIVIPQIIAKYLFPVEEDKELLEIVKEFYRNDKDRI